MARERIEGQVASEEWGVRAEGKDLEFSRKLQFFGKAIKLRTREVLIGFRHPFDLDAQAREGLVVELEKLELLSEAKTEEALTRLGKLNPERGRNG